ncbi:MAG: SWIM zinc finger family protein [Geothrix sp.]|nr:SWIM zinc finger family protein [Geothrix sp.]
MSQMSERFGTTWWGQLWITALEKLGDDFENRLPRGKKYAEEGAVSHFTVTPGEIQAKVHGRKTYNVTLGLPALSASQWDKALERIYAESRFVASLLAGEMPQGLDETFREAGASLYPRVPKELQTHCDCPDWANPCKHVAAVCYIMAEALDRDPWLLFDLRGRTREEVLEALQAQMEAPAEPAPRKRGRPKKVVSVVDLLPRRNEMAEPWLRMSDEAYDQPPVPIPEVVLPRAIPADPSVFIQLGPLPHARIEASLCLAALMHRTAQIVQIQIEEGVGNMEEPEVPQSEVEAATSPFESPITPPPSSKPWRHNKKRRWGKG